MSETQNLTVLGAGPAGLTAAYEAQRLETGHRPVILEAGALVGGIARTESHDGFRFDIGGHRFFTKVPEIAQLWEEIMGADFITVPRKSRIYYGGKFYDYPLRISNALGNLGTREAAHTMASYAKWRIFPSKTEDNLEEWVMNRFGGRLYGHFFRSYTEKVWGIPCTEIAADWAEQRIKNLSLSKAVWNALTGANDTASLIEEFRYPRLGPGMMWEKVAAGIEAEGGEVRTRTRVTAIEREGDRIVAVRAEGPDGPSRVETDEVVSTLALRDLVEMVEPAPPPEVVQAAARLKYRDFLIVALQLDDDDPFDDNWIYIHSPEVKVGRIQNFRAWSREMVPEGRGTSVGMEYFCHEGDGLWTSTDEELIDLAGGELEELGLGARTSVRSGKVIRQPKAYPVYDAEYRDAVATIEGWVKSLENFQTVGRNGLHRYNNQDHSMLTALLAARNLTDPARPHDVWTVNVERAYHETFTVADRQRATAQGSHLGAA
jgi:protoporphyrinogen oxidase